MIDKKTFIETIDFIRKERQLEDNLCSTLESMTDACICDALIYTKYENTLVNILMLALEDKDEVIPYFIYDLEFGESKTIDPKSAFSINDKHIDLSSAEKVYDYLMRGN